MHEEVIMAGTGGQGIMIMGQLLAHAGMTEGREVVWFPSYGPEARGGTADCTVIISSEEIGSPISAHPDTLIGMHQFLFSKFQPCVKPGGLLLVNSSLIDLSIVRGDCKVFAIDANVRAEELGNVRVANMIMLGAYAALTKVVSLDSLIASLAQVLPPHRHKFIPLNEQALLKGAELAATVQ
ncbi:MAG: 2-oxoacid:acceptor oxidoreductase family protein [Armatimonadota bacterium]|nr:2-oxoacid:acceptor oxidoreductase family protein [Armatimonadota bacterium]